MSNISILENQIGKHLTDGKLMSFYLDGKLIDRILITYLNHGDWIQIISTDEKTTVRNGMGKTEIFLDENDEEFRYTIEPIEKYFPAFEKYKGKKLLNVTELVLKTSEYMSFGLNLYYEDNLNLIIHNLDYPEDRNEYVFENRIPEDLEEK